MNHSCIRVRIVAMSSSYTTQEIDFLRLFHRELETTTNEIHIDVVKKYWNITQAHYDPFWRSRPASDAYFRILAKDMTETRQFGLVHRPPTV